MRSVDAKGRAPLPVLTSLRFLAASDVVLTHFLVSPKADLLHNLASAGRQSVTFFFVLSGFILAYVYSGAAQQDHITASAGAFWKARFARIMPAYWLGLLVGFPLLAYGFFVSKITPVSVFVKGVLLTPLLLQAWWPPAEEIWNPPAWSLSVEFLFYACFPLIAAQARRVSPWTLLSIALAATLLTAGLTHQLAPRSDVPLPQLLFAWHFPLLHLAQFVLGVAVGRLFLFGPSLAADRHALIFYVASIAALLVIGYRNELPWWVSSNAVLAPTFGLLIFGAAKPTGGIGFLALPIPVLLGEASYALYILHQPLLFWWNWSTRSLFLPPEIAFLLYFGLAVSMSVLTYLYVETPARRWLLGHREHPAAPVAFSSAQASTPGPEMGS